MPQKSATNSYIGGIVSRLDVGYVYKTVKFVTNLGRMLMDSIKKNSHTIFLLNQLRKLNESLGYTDQRLGTPEPLGEILTLERGFFRPLTAMLRARFDFCASWKDACITKDWLSLSEIKEYVNNRRIVELISLRIENWNGFPPQSVLPECCAIFGYDPYSTDETYLVWNNHLNEPEIWDYLGGEYFHHKNLNDYLKKVIEVASS
jgi:hypothetical protein